MQWRGKPPGLHDNSLLYHIETIANVCLNPSLKVERETAFEGSPFLATLAKIPLEASSYWRSRGISVIPDGMA